MLTTKSLICYYADEALFLCGGKLFMVVKRLNTSNGRLLFVSDVHGEVGVLEKALEVLEFEEGKDNLVCAGDLIDRGSDSVNTMDFFLKDNTGSYHTVLGNHDMFAIDNNHATTCELWVMNGGMWAFQELTQAERDEYATMLSELPVAIEVLHKGYKIGVVHASVPEEFECWGDFVNCLEDGNTDLIQQATWDRTFIEYTKHHKDNHLSGVCATVHGHTPVRKPVMVGNRLHIDTGLVYGKHLTIMEFEGGEFTEYRFDIGGKLIEEA